MSARVVVNVLEYVLVMHASWVYVLANVSLITVILQFCYQLMALLLWFLKIVNVILRCP